MIGPFGRLGPAATLRQHCPQMTQRCCIIKDAAMLKEHRYCDRIAACEVSEGEGGIGIRDATEGGRQGKTKETTCGGGDCMAACNPKPKEGEREGEGAEQPLPNLPSVLKQCNGMH